ncbi:hypothetical protein MPTK1_6g15600 [Marchantia polymorpha subsp. ruderalis]|uniref:Uncharacterized protein n=2 Tax=Marchantia polymorpha TaxID=3197 RepID=A0A176WDK6_MARPO|nr:hypothetical protein AXG93_4295s1620 [Marchantia polymorpha subsp. ruderalis]PTQ37615.1 hypothetical protein MARPO_0056s0072 [Marchantia polymorpha]BBN14931.1 hypothetical protein Mp_6g15600 [Marchantia polymorpha subsp. ruderalis]|eukprot:PTQ37615.1 hypothetical protein MARPO_0056s0072 [Marchantia polymorpha]
MRPGARSECDELEDEIERILRHQQTHELTCPVCDSCVTKRLIIRKRKRSSTTDDAHRLAKARKSCEKAISSVIKRRHEVYDAHKECIRSQSPPHSPTSVIVDDATDPEDEKGWSCFPCLPCFFSFFYERGPGQLERQRSLRDAAADFGPDDTTPLLQAQSRISS